MPELEDPPELLAAHRARVKLVFHAPPAVLGIVRLALRRMREISGRDDGWCLHQLLTEFAHEHAAGERLPGMMRRHATFRRDNFRCAMPHCTSRGPLHEHHIIFLSRGGPDVEWNVITLCAGCHRLIHDGLVVLTGRAPDGLTVVLGSGREVYVNGFLQRAA